MAKKGSEFSYKAGDTLNVKQTRSVIARPYDQKLTLESMGLGKIGHSHKHTLNASLLGKLKKIWHLVEVEKA